jgi:hypothetical protein
LVSVFITGNWAGLGERFIKIMVYTVKPAITEGCDCEDCRAGRHPYFLYRLPATGKNWSALSLQTYQSAQQCQREHRWGLAFGPDDVWEDGTPIVVPKPKHKSPPSANGKVILDADAFAKSAEMLQQHWSPEGSDQ